MRGLDLADQHIGVGHGQRAAAPIAGGAGMGAALSGPTRNRDPS
jgi:hypothetical protein